MKHLELRDPTLKLVREYISKFESNESIAASNRAVTKLFCQLPHNNALDDVLLKVVALNQLYSTKIFATFAVARHICKLDIDPMLKQGDLALVSRIAHVQLQEKTRNFYSFASKYCSFHVPDSYPMYDEKVKRLLTEYRHKTQFATFTAESLKDYPTFRNVLDRFAECFGLGQFTRNQLDQCLWMYGREL